MSCEGKNLSGQPLSSLTLGACQATKAVNMGDKTGLADSNIFKQEYCSFVCLNDDW